MKHQLSNLRLDASTTVFLERELTAVDPRKYLEVLPRVKGMMFVPPVTGIGPYTKTYEYSMWTITGEAKPIGKNAKDLPMVGVKRRPFTRSITTIGDAYGWPIEDVRAAAQAGVDLEDITVIAAMSAINRKLDRRIALGDSDLGFTGLCNDAYILANNSVTPVSTFTSAANKLDSLNKLVADTRARLKDASEMLGGDGQPVFDKLQILLPMADYAAVKQTQLSANYKETILNVFLESNSEWVSGVSEWSYLDGIDGGEGRAVAYPLNPIALGHVLARSYTEESPQYDGLNVTVPCHAASGGTVIRYPVAFSYMKLGA